MKKNTRKFTEATEVIIEKDLSVNKNNTFKVFAGNNLKASSRVAIAMRIYDDKESVKVMAEMLFQEGDSLTFAWNSIEDRQRHLPLINGYTLIYDERVKEAEPFEYWKNRK